jgi:hypothetical protein
MSPWAGGTPRIHRPEEVTVSSADERIATSPDVSIGPLGYRAQLQAHAFDAWREAELQVHARWDALLMADRRSRRAAFAALTRALDAEAVAADALAQTHLDLAAAA